VQTDNSSDPFPHLADLDSSGNSLVQAYRRGLEIGAQSLATRFDNAEAVDHLVKDRSRLVDEVLQKAWHQFAQAHSKSLALVAVGGYGRGELHPGSDIDIMVLIDDSQQDGWQEPVEQFLTFLWDIGLEVGHSVRTLEDCERQAAADITVATALMESRLLDGPDDLLSRMREAVGPQHMWGSREFFEAKLKEQEQRHHRFHDTAYNLEPNVKSSPGGMRDIQLVGWVAKRHFGVDSFHQLYQHGFLTNTEYRKLLAGQTFLWRIRWALHSITDRREDRLLFDHQITISRLFGYEDASHTLGVEQFMQKYYRTVMELSRLNEMLLQLFQEAILLDPEAVPKRLSDSFQARNGFLEVSGENIFENDPSALLEVFKSLQENPGLRGVSAHTIRLIRRNLTLIDEEFRQNPRNHRLFLDIIRAPSGVTHELRRMNRYGVLGRYIPMFGRIVGRMQYDLFHAYTVDAHTIFVVSNLRRLALPRFDHEFPSLGKIMQSLDSQELVYLAGLFHDIAKGRGGDHSELGAVDAESFCLEQGLPLYDARVVAWLVRHHLALSLTAQKKDIKDPQVVGEFARLVGDQNHLDCLYLLTVADVRATNPNLWNSWKQALFEEFYQSVSSALRRGLDKPIDTEELVAQTQAKSLQILELENIHEHQARDAWDNLTEDYFLRHAPEEVAWHSKHLLEFDGTNALVAVNQESARGGTAILVYTPYARRTFASVTAILVDLGLNIVDARITPTRNGRSLDTYHVLEIDGSIIDEPDRIAQIESSVSEVLDHSDELPKAVNRQAPRQVRMFVTPTRIGFSRDARGRTLMELLAADRPGLLFEVGKVLLDEGIAVQTAKIMTIGERAEDVFSISNPEGKPLEESVCDQLRDRLLETLDNVS
jgi:[protein-PII] uridylyltransferase